LNAAAALDGDTLGVCCSFFDVGLTPLGVDDIAWVDALIFKLISLWQLYSLHLRPVVRLFRWIFIPLLGKFLLKLFKGLLGIVLNTEGLFLSVLVLGLLLILILFVLHHHHFFLRQKSVGLLGPHT
jgi:hypothetical protein